MPHEREGNKLTTLEAARMAAQPRLKYTPAQQTLHLFCIRCERYFPSEFLSRECPLCMRAAVKAFGTAHPRMEMIGT